MSVVGVQTDNTISKNLVRDRLQKLRNKILWVEDIYYQFRTDVEEALQEAKYQLDKLSQMTGEEDVIE